MAKPTSPFKEALQGREFSESSNFVENRARTESLPNGRQQRGAFGAAHKGVALRAAPFGVLVVFHLVRISYVLVSFPETVLVRFSIKFADSENSLPQRGLFKESSCNLLRFAQ